MPAQRTDDELLAAARRSPEAFGAIFDRYVVPIHRFLEHRLDRAAAEDAAAETFVRALLAIDRAKTTEGSLRAWLYSIAANLARDEHRRRARAKRASARLERADVPEQPSGHTDGPDAEVLQALRSLREEEQEALVLLAWGDLNYREIAAATGVPIGTVRSRISRARAQLRTTLSAMTTETTR